MKSLSLSRTNAERDGGQSVTSQVDSASNYEEQIDGTVTEDANAAPVKTPLGLDDPFKALPQTDLTFCGNFVFNRNRRAVPQLNPATGQFLLRIELTSLFQLYVSTIRLTL